MTRPMTFEQLRLDQDPIKRRERRAVAMRAYVATDDGATGEAMVLDLSYDGCGIETPLALLAGKPVTLAVQDRGTVRAHVRWWANGRGGLVFEKVRAEDENGQRREDERVKLKFEAALRRLGMGSYRVSVSDLSSLGCKVELVERPRVGEHVLLKFDQMDALEAEVCWIQGHEAGLRFERPIHEGVLALMMGRLNSGA